MIIATWVSPARACYNDRVMRSSMERVRLSSMSKGFRVNGSLLMWVVFSASTALFAATSAPGTLFGDPSEYQFIPAIWGIAHPPGYAFYTLLAGLWQRVIAIGSVAYRTNLLASVAGAWAASRVTAIVLSVTAGRGPSEPVGTGRLGDERVRADAPGLWISISAVVAGIAVATAADVWQHSIHANAHVVSAAITITQLWLLVEWWRTDRVVWLFALACLVGIGVTHHPITVWGVPGYLLFIVLQRPKIVTEWRTVLGGIGCAFLGFLPWLYFPLRSASAPFGPTDMGTWAGFLRHATAQGLRVNLFHFGLADQPDRWQVFLSLLRLQYGWPLLALMLLGFVGLTVSRPRLGVLWISYLAGHLLFTLNSVQDVMAYLLNVFVPLGVPLAIGLVMALSATSRRWLRLTLVGGFTLLVVGRVIYTFPRVSLHDWRDADSFVDALQARFEYQGRGVALLSDWEHLTPYYYRALVEGDPISAEDLRPVYVTGAQPWVASVFANLPAGDTYLTNYRRDVRDLGFRLRPVGTLWQVLEPPATAIVTPEHTLSGVLIDGRVELLGYDLPGVSVAQGGSIPLVLYTRAQQTLSAIVMPSVSLGGIEQRFTTDSRHLTPEWLPGEVIVERYEVYVPFSLAAGRYPLSLRYDELTGERRTLRVSDSADALSLGEIDVVPVAGARRRARAVDRGLANIGNQALLESAWARVGGTVRLGLWDSPLTARSGQVLHLRLTWHALARPSTSYTVFIHVIDAQGHVIVGHDYTPLGGAFPSYLWFPKWLEGQSVQDPYRLELPPDLPAGEYFVEVGMYEMGSIRRIALLSPDGTMVGDRLILGALVISD